MAWFSYVNAALRLLLRWWRKAPHVGSGLLLTGVAIMFAVLLSGYDLSQHFDDTANALETPKKIAGESEVLHFYVFILPYLSLMLLLSVVGTFFYAFRVWPRVGRMALPLALTGILMTADAVAAEVYTYWSTKNFSMMGEPLSRAAYLGKLSMIIFLALSPALMATWYAARSSLERYTLRNFLQPLGFCFIAFISLFLLIDLIGNIREYQENHTPTSAVVIFYVQLLPAVFVMIAPWACLFATLYSLVRMSRFNEIISMLSAGRSLWQIAYPVLVVGAYVSMVAMALNYYWAPHAENQRKTLTETATKRNRTRGGGASIANTVMYFNPETRRSWFIGKVPYDTQKESLNRVEVRQFDDKGKIQHTWLALSARWWPNGTWSLRNGVEILYTDGVQSDPRPFERHGNSVKGSTTHEQDFSETPWSIISSALLPDDLGVGELTAYLHANAESPKEKLNPFRTHLYDRFARPWLAWFMVFSAVPLGIAYSRRAALGGMAGAMLLVVGLLFLPELFANMGKGGHTSPKSAVWMTHAIFFAFGLVMFVLKSRNREFPRFSFAALKRGFKPAPAKAKPALT
jgi:lipopolysaccharide export system permease protein